MRTKALPLPSVDAPPAFVRLIAHPVRWRLLRELVVSDRAVWELAELIGEPQNLVSYHLRQLRQEGVVFARRSAADRRDTFYALDLLRCEEWLQTAGSSLHPGFRLVPASDAEAGPKRGGRKPRVLFLCTGNSARSQMAEALIERLSDGGVEAWSAGSDPKPLHANAVRAMAARGIDIRGSEPKHLEIFATKRFDLVVSLCDRVREVCEDVFAQPCHAHWSIPDPTSEAGGYDAFERTAAELETRIRFLLPLLQQRTTRRSAHAR